MTERYGRPHRLATVHRVIPAGPRNELRTACRIKLAPTDIPGCYSDADNGGLISVTERGQPFDCKRCNRVLLLRHENAGFNISGRSE